MPSARQSRICDLLILVINRYARGTFATAPADRLRHLGRLFAEIAQLPLDEFRLLASEARLASVCGELA